MKAQSRIVTKKVFHKKNKSKNSRQFLELIIRQANNHIDPTMVYDLDMGLVLCANESFRSTFDMDSVEESISILDALLPDQIKDATERKKLNKLINQMTKSGKPKRFQLNISSKYRLFECTANVLKENNSPILTISFRQVKVPQIQLESFLDTIPSAIIQINAKKDILYLSQSAKELFEIDAYLPLQYNLENIFKNESKTNFDKWFRKLSNKKDQTETIVLKGDNFSGNNVFIEAKAVSLINKSTEDTYLLYLQDLTDHLKSELALMDRESTMHSILENTPLCIYAIDKKFNVIFANETAIDQFKSHQNVDLNLGDNLKTLLPKSLFKFWNKEYFQKALKGESFSITGPVANNKNIITYSNYSPLLNGFNQIIGYIVVSEDITELKANEYKLAESEAYLKSLLNNTNDSILAVDNQGQVTALNNKARQTIKSLFNTEVRIGDLIEDKIPDHQLVKICKDNRKIFKSGTFKEIIKHELKNNIVYHDNYYSLIRDKSNRVIGYLEVSKDVTEPHNYQEALKLSEKKYKNLIELIPAAVLMINLDGNPKFISPQFYTLMDVSEEENPYQYNINDIIEDDLIAISNQYNACDSNEVNSIYTTAKKFNGDSIPVEIIFKCINYQGNKNLFCILRDVSEKINAAKETNEKQKIYQALVDHSFDGIDIIEVIENEDGSYSQDLIMRNDNMMQYFNSTTDPFYRTEDVLQRSTKYQADGRLTLDVLKQDIDYFRKHRRLITERKVIDESGNLRHIIISTQAITIDERNLIVRYYKDITERKTKDIEIKNNLDELHKKNNELEKYIKSNLNLEKFAYVASHDLKSPLRTIASFGQLLRKSIYNQIQEKERVFLDIILNSSKQMQLLVDDLLSFSRVNSVKIKFEEIDLKSFIDFTIKQISSEIETKQATVEIANAPATIYADKIKLSQIIQNLVRNGIKFQREDTLPHIIINVEESAGNYTFSIADNGIGIEEEYVGEIFNIFKKLHSKDEYEGNGIGLSICQQIAEKHNGKIWVESEFGKGSTFFFSISKNLTSTD